MATILKTVRDYIPTFGGNDKKNPDDIIIAKLKSLNVKLRQDQIKKFLKTKPDELLEKLMDEKQSNEIHQILKDNVIGFKNFKVDEGQVEPDPDKPGETRPVLREGTLSDLYAMGEFGICVELFMNIINHSQLSQETAKNSESQSGSTPQRVLEGQVVETAH